MCFENKSSKCCGTSFYSGRKGKFKKAKPVEKNECARLDQSEKNTCAIEGQISFADIELPALKFPISRKAATPVCQQIVSRRKKNKPFDIFAIVDNEPIEKR